MTEHPPETPAFQVFSDADGSVTIGWIAGDVLYAKFKGKMSAELGAAYTRQLEIFVSGASSVRFYADASDLTEYDLSARSAFVRVVMAHRRKFVLLVMLTWVEGRSRVTDTFVATFGEGTHILVDSGEFYGLLRRAAPDAAHAIARRARAPTLR